MGGMRVECDARSVLVVDDLRGGLGELALRLIRLGIDGHYAADPGEAWLLAQQEAPRIRLLLLAPGVDLQELRGILAELAQRAPEVPRALLAVGPRPAPERRDELRKAGVFWALWDPWDEAALRTALAGALSVLPDGVGSRRSPRFPTTLLGRAFKGIHRKDGLVSSLSEGGAFLETPQPFEPGTRVTLEIESAEGPLVVKAEVLYNHLDGAGGRPPGMGLSFLELSVPARERLQRTLVEHRQRFEV